MEEKLNIIKIAYQKLYDKFNELEDYFANITLVNERESQKYANINENSSACEYKNKFIKEIQIFREKYLDEMSQVNSDNISIFIKKIVNNYAKIEDEYYMLLSSSKNDEITSKALFKNECLLFYLKNNIKIILDNYDFLIEKVKINNLEK